MMAVMATVTLIQVHNTHTLVKVWLSTMGYAIADYGVGIGYRGPK